jgi:hypothetical protein
MSDPSNTTRKSPIGGGVEIPGHEKTITPLQEIVAEYRTASFDSSGKYNFSRRGRGTYDGRGIPLSPQR